MKSKLNYRQIWLEALRKGEVRLDFDSPEEVRRKRQGFYTSIRPFRQGKRGHTELERAAAEVTLFVVEETNTIVLQHYKLAMGRVALNVQEVISPEVQAPIPEMTSDESERIAAMARSALEKINGGKSTPYYNRGSEES